MYPIFRTNQRKGWVGGLNKPQNAIPEPEIMYEYNAMILSVIFTENLSIRKPKHRLAASASCKKKTAELLADIQVVDLVWYSCQRKRFFRTGENIRFLLYFVSLENFIFSNDNFYTIGEI